MAAAQMIDKHPLHGPMSSRLLVRRKTAALDGAVQLWQAHAGLEIQKGFAVRARSIHRQQWEVAQIGHDTSLRC